MWCETPNFFMWCEFRNFFTWCELVIDDVYMLNCWQDLGADAEKDILTLVLKIDKAIKDINIPNIQKDVIKIPADDTYQMVIDIIYWSIIGLVSVIAAIITINVMGLILGLVLSPRRSSEYRMLLSFSHIHL